MAVKDFNTKRLYCRRPAFKHLRVKPCAAVVVAATVIKYNVARLSNSSPYTDKAVGFKWAIGCSWLLSLELTNFKTAWQSQPSIRPGQGNSVKGSEAIVCSYILPVKVYSGV